MPEKVEHEDEMAHSSSAHRPDLSEKQTNEIEILFNLLKCALRNESLKAHFKAENIFAGIFFDNPGSKIA